MAPRSLAYSVNATIASLASRTVLIFFIPGNPGLIEYYAPFLTSLRHLLESSPAAKATTFDIYGQDLAGFHDDDHEPFNSSRPPYDLEYQINHIFAKLTDIRIEDGLEITKPKVYDDVVLIGHSVGSYIALQLFQRLLKDQEAAPHLHLKTGILLFPTIEQIAKSTNGWKLDLLRRTPILGSNAHYIAKGFLTLMPDALLLLFLGKILGMPPYAAGVTLQFLKSRDGVWQALHLGMNEMEVIAKDTWDDELWGITQKAKIHDQPVPKFFFFFGKDDDWVATKLRDDFIQKRSKQVEGTKFIIDEGHLPHAFCLGHSELVADKVSVWINEIYEKDIVPTKSAS